METSANGISSEIERSAVDKIQEVKSDASSVLNILTKRRDTGTSTYTATHIAYATFQTEGEGSEQIFPESTLRN